MSLHISHFYYPQGITSKCHERPHLIQTRADFGGKDNVSLIYYRPDEKNNVWQLLNSIKTCSNAYKVTIELIYIQNIYTKYIYRVTLNE